MHQKLAPRILALFLLLALMLPACSGTTGPSPAETPAADAQPALMPFTIASVTVEIGVGSPIPVDVVVSGDWPALCAQLAEVKQTFAGTRFDITLLATPSDPNCPADQVGLAFRLAVPLNMTQLPAGDYQVAVNGVEASFTWPAAVSQEPAVPLSTQSATYLIAFIGPDGNVWLVDRQSGAQRQVTQDAAPLQPNNTAAVETITYSEPRLSSDGQFVAFRGEIGKPVDTGYEYKNGLWVFDAVAGLTRAVMEDKRALGYDWKPGTHVLAFALAPETNYFAKRGKPDATLASGIYGYDADQSQTSVLVKPERDYTLAAPQWSPDGNLLSFDEIFAMEGRGNFGYYDFSKQSYVPAGEAIGNYSWSPDGSQIAYDRLSYAPNGSERVVINQRQGGQEQPLAPETPGGYTFGPVFSPQGDRVAYLGSLSGLEANQYTLFVQNVAGGEPTNLGNFEQAWYPAWTPDGSKLVLSAGPMEAQQLIEVDPASGQAVVLAQGSQPALATP